MKYMTQEGIKSRFRLLFKLRDVSNNARLVKFAEDEVSRMASIMLHEPVIINGYKRRACTPFWGDDCLLSSNSEEVNCPDCVSGSIEWRDGVW